MEKDLMEEALKPVVSRFLDEILRIEDNTKSLEKSLSIQLEKIDSERKTLVEKEKEIENRIVAIKNNYGDRLVDVDKLKKKLSDEISQYNDLQNIIRKDKDKTKRVLQNAESERKLAATTHDTAKNTLKKYTDKLDSLKLDDITIDKKTRELAERERFIRIKEGVNLKEERRLNDKENNLLERELDVKIKEKNIKLAAKAYEANK